MLLWILARCNGEADAVETAVGYEPKADDIDIEGSGIDGETLKALLSIDKAAWEQEVKEIETHLAGFEKLPAELRDQFEALKARVERL